MSIIRFVNEEDKNHENDETLIDLENQLYAHLKQTGESGEEGIDEGDDKNDVGERKLYFNESASRHIFRLQ